MKCPSLIAGSLITLSFAGNINCCAADEKGERLKLREAREYMLALINRDREKEHLPPVKLDETATKAGQLHADEMARGGYCSHWSENGLDPLERYTASGGSDFVMENVNIKVTNDFDWQSPPAQMSLSAEPEFKAAEIEALEETFMNEKPPADGHRRNILDPKHNLVGIGLALAESQRRGRRLTCAQEFVTRAGDIRNLPPVISAGQVLALAGRLQKGYQIYNIDIRRTEAPRRRSVEELNQTRSFPQPPDALVIYFPPPYNSPLPVQVKEEADASQSFKIDIPTSTWGAGAYYITVWAKGAGEKAPDAVSEQAVIVQKSQ